MGKGIVIESTHTYQADRQDISLEKWLKKREQRRKRVAKRMALRFPLFAVEFTREEFPQYTQDQFQSDIEGKKLPKKRKGKSPLKRMGRYRAMRDAITEYRITGDIEHLRRAQQLRNRMFQPYEIDYRLGKERKIVRLAAETDYKKIVELANIKFSSWKELDEILEDKTRWIHIS